MSELKHYGTPRHSGRYPWGSGKNPIRSKDFRSTIADLKSKGLNEKEIASAMNMTTTELRRRNSIAKMEERKENELRALQLKEKGYSPTQIAKLMSVNGKEVNESTVRSWLNPQLSENNQKTRAVADSLKTIVDKKLYVDVGAGTNIELGITENRLKTAIALLEEEGYRKHYIQIDQLGTGHKTTVEVLTKDDVDYNTLKEHKYDIQPVSGQKYTDTDGTTKLGMLPVQSISSERIKIRYSEDGGVDRDGVIELRPGVSDISLGRARYAQVRIGVDGQHYLKGMALYSDSIPDGYDIVFNTNKPKGTPMEKVFKPMRLTKDGQVDPDNPFGATIKDADTLRMAQRYYLDSKGEKKISAINIVNEEGDWGRWQKSLASQFVSKQPEQLASRQLQQELIFKKQELADIMSLTNPTIRKKMLAEFADKCDSAAVDLKAASLPRQTSSVILPFPKLKDDEVYAPNYKDGEEVVLIRYPHGGIFEIPKLRVRNKGSAAAKYIKNAPDAIGINSKVAERLSGADFDGDTVIIIPISDKVKIRTSKQLEGLKNFDPKAAYPAYEGMPKMKSKTKQTEMGKISNLITDMTIRGAKPEELAKAVRHSMVVIDAEKHHLNYKQSYIDNDIASLKLKYQNGGGASTLISRASSVEKVNARKDYYLSKNTVNPQTGEKIYTPTNEFYTKRWKLKDGTVRERILPVMQDSTKMAEAKDAFTLTSGGSKSNYGSRIESYYAQYANSLKAMANQARKTYISTENLKYSPSAAKLYSKEVAQLNASLNVALKNAPRERQAQLVAHKIFVAKLDDNPDISGDKDKVKKLKGQALNAARKRVGAKKELIDISAEQWTAIQAGAISDSKLRLILDNSDADKLKRLAMPNGGKTLPPSKVALIKSLADRDYTNAEIADRLGVSTASVHNVLAGE